MKIVIIGLGRMGKQIARKLAEDGHEVIAHNRSREPIDEVTKYGAKPAYEKVDVIKAFESGQLVLWLMLPAEAVDAQLAEWLRILPPSSVIVDGGNSYFKNTLLHAELVHGHGSQFVDVGTSGGVLGYKNGFSMMAGGDEPAFKVIEPALKTIAQPRGAYHYFGEGGSGHYVKMVHNAIEYGLMESYAEGYRILKDGYYKNLDLAAAAEVWQHGSVIESLLNDLTLQALKENPELKGVEGVVAETGEARWTLETAKELGIPMPAIQSAFDVRLASQKGETNFATKLLAAMRAKFGGHDINPKT
jgi:6-phosphogluconate dehydrogenase